MFYNALALDYNCCPTNCSACEEICSQAKKGVPGLIKAVHVTEVNYHSVITCTQCSEPSCIEICPTGAITKSDNDGIIRVNDTKCVGCGLCTLLCLYGGIQYHRDKEQAAKCDLCDGEPKCIDACKYDVLSFFKSRTLQDYLDKEDLLSPGVGLCAGCTAELLLRTTLKVLGKNTILFWAASCAAPAISGVGSMAGTKIATTSCLMPSIPAYITGISRYYRRKGKNYNFVAFAGDGATADIGFQSLSGAAERGEKCIYICYDNEAYMNTGIQRSGTTCPGAWTTTTPIGVLSKGKGEPAKYLPLLMMFHGVPYVATATVAYLLDFVEKLKKAMAVQNGMAYIHVHCPCPTGWRAPTDTALEMSKLAVQTNYFPLWEAEKGQVKFTYKVENPKPVIEFTKLMGRFEHLTKDGVDELQGLVNSRIELLKMLSK